MAVVITKSNIVDAYVNRQRIRTMNYHGSPTYTTVIDNNSWGSSDAGSILYLTLIPYGAVINTMQIAFSGAKTELAFTLGIAGINPDRTFTAIKDDLLTYAAFNQNANVASDLGFSQKWGNTIYQQLCAEAAPYTPIAAFKPYKDNEFGVLYLKSTIKNTAALVTTRFKISWIDPVPSGAPRIHTTINTLNPREAA